MHQQTIEKAYNTIIRGLRWELALRLSKGSQGEVRCMAKVRSGELAREARQGPVGWQHSKRFPRGDVRGVSERVLSPPPRPAP